nr:immunoglobulin heavy chain junction region [Mus musculus]MBK4189066.1 immunoglobulin heavy chain junction region [Mus musculus]MBK4189067.1 immunoglobulin heavy chain junction region [Mus musculus]MBK4189069.1 immunoglobulin heavy chain junction region [Mus musculus]MBK4189070.1 immunoglobulin heavy chain junction region [Mus musculus]
CSRNLRGYFDFW